KTPHYRGLLDAAFFWQEYKNIVETETVFNDTTTNALIKLRFNNITRARIAGWDISFKNDVNYKKHALSFNIGYTSFFNSSSDSLIV
ncbi:MAG TPA: TonB-dependent receptor, partial [Candidatus Syntrophosphaera thermopropionivorans]|nr:TonB-dependent receptor [Candidatus Syntrophosphaera thermopropionivorans]